MGQPWASAKARTPAVSRTSAKVDPSDPSDATEDLDIECAPTTAFDLMADVRNEMDWNDDVSRAELTTDSPIGQGSQFVTSHGSPLGQIESTITTFDRPERLEFSATSKRMDLAISLTFTETDLELTDPATNTVLHLDATGVRRAGRELVTFGGTVNAFDVLQGIADDLRDPDGLSHADLRDRLGLWLLQKLLGTQQSNTADDDPEGKSEVVSHSVQYAIPPR